MRFVPKEFPPSEFILALPKAELHLHLEGTVTPETLIELADRHHQPYRPEHSRYREVFEGDLRDPGLVHKLYHYEDFSGFLLAFKAVTEQMRTADDYELVTHRMMEQLKRENVLYAEVFVSVGVVHWRGQEFPPLFAGMERGRQRGTRDFGVEVRWIFDAVRHFGVDAATRVIEEALKLRRRYPTIVGFGIGGDERRGEAVQFRELYAYAHSNGMRLSAHAGENVGPESIWSALRDLKAERIGHAIHAQHDPELLMHLAASRTPIEICISSNVLTACCLAVQEHPVAEFHERGLMLTLNSDDPAMFHTTLSHEYQIAQSVFRFSNDDLRELARNSFRASFLPEQEREGYLAMF